MTHAIAEERCNTDPIEHAQIPRTEGLTEMVSAQETPFHQRPPQAVAGRSCPRVLFVESYPQVLYGQQQTMLALLGQSRCAGIEPLVGVPGEGAFVDSARQIGIGTTQFPYPAMLGQYGGAVYRYGPLKQAAFAWQVTRYILQAARELRRLSVSGVFCNDLRGLLTIGVAARTLRIPVMIWDKLDRPHGWLDHLQLPLANRTVFISEAVKAKFSDRSLKKYGHRLETISNGVAPARFDNAEPIRQTLGIRDHEIAIGLVGAITYRKGQDRLLAVVPELAHRVSNVRVFLIGDASLSQQDQTYRGALPHQNHPAVEFLGLRQDIPQIMKSLDVLVVPSRYEGMGRVVVEAMACRKPVVAAQTGGIREVVVEGETGLLVDGDDPQELLNALLTLCQSQSLRVRLGRAGRERMSRFFDQETQINRVLLRLVDLVTRGVK